MKTTICSIPAQVSSSEAPILFSINSSRLSVSVIEGILRNEIYKGDRQLQKAPHVDLLTHRPEPGAEYRTYYLEADHEGIVSRELWEKVQEVLVTPKTTRCNKNSHFLKGKVICGDCGKPYVDANAKGTITARGNEKSGAVPSRERSAK